MAMERFSTYSRIGLAERIGVPTSPSDARISAFVLAGGNGTRLWPLSRRDNPKQFHRLSTSVSMLGETILRLGAESGGAAHIHVIASQRHAERLREEAAKAGLADGKLLLEPMGRGTAAGVALAALVTLAEHGDGLVLVAPSDHAIATPQAFWETVRKGTQAALGGRIVVFGIEPSRPETGFGYVEAAPGTDHGGACDVVRFIEKPDLATARSFVESGGFYWNSGIFLFRAGAMRDVFLTLQPALWRQAAASLAVARKEEGAIHLEKQAYAAMPSLSFDRAIMERATAVSMVPATFRWNDVGSWRALLEVSPRDPDGNVTIGDVVTLDCTNSYIRSEGRLLSAVGVSNMAIVATQDAMVVAPVDRCQDIGRMVEVLDRRSRPETSYTPEGDNALPFGAWRSRILQWLSEDAFPLWSRAGVDRVHGGFHEALDFDGDPLARPRRMRTMARQVYAFAVASEEGWSAGAREAVTLGLDFLEARPRGAHGGWVRVLGGDGAVLDGVEDLYDTACVLLALAHAHRCGDRRALRLAGETFAFVDRHLADRIAGGCLETAAGGTPRRSNPHMHLLEACLAWHAATGERAYLARADAVVELFRRRFFDPATWTVGEYFSPDWKPAEGQAGDWTEPGHHFEWAALLVEHAAQSGRPELEQFARKLYSSAFASGTNRATGLAFAAVSRRGSPIDTASRSWQQAEAVRAAIAIDRIGGADMKPEIEARIARLFRWHIASVPAGLWIDRVDARGAPLSQEVPASILYHLTSAFADYLNYSAREAVRPAGAAAAPFRTSGERDVA